jgi:CRP-like cAMP-binding protein
MQKPPHTSHQLTEVAPFDRLGRAQLHSLEPNIDRVTVDKGTVLASEDHHAHQLVIVVDGEVVERRGQRTVRVLGRGDLVGAVELATGRPHRTTVVTVGTVEVLVLHEQAVRWLLLERPDLTADLLAA